MSGSVFWWCVFVVVWVAIAFWPARVAGRKGHSFILYFLFSLVFFPAALIVAYVVRDRRTSSYAEGRRLTVRLRCEPGSAPIAAIIACRARSTAW